LDYHKIQFGLNYTMEFMVLIGENREIPVRIITNS